MQPRGFSTNFSTNQGARFHKVPLLCAARELWNSSLSQNLNFLFGERHAYD